jgi:hypothetical protein
MSVCYNVILISAASVLLWTSGGFQSLRPSFVDAWVMAPSSFRKSAAHVPSEPGVAPSIHHNSYIAHRQSIFDLSSKHSNDQGDDEDSQRAAAGESRFGFRRRVNKVLRSRRLFSSSADDDLDDSSWSRSGESRFGVRRRVKKVLQRAKSRTGISNSSEEYQYDDDRPLKTKQSSFTIVAESASIGGLGGVLVDEKGTVDVALELARKKANGSSSSTATKTAPRNGASGSEMSIQSVDKSSPEDEFVMASSVNQFTNTDRCIGPSKEVIASDVPAAVELPDPLPFTLPKLSQSQKQQLLNDERVQEQSKMGREGSGFVVLDVKAPPYVVWECLLDFESYTETIPTVRGVTMYTSQHLESGYHKEKPVRAGTNTTLPVRHYGRPSVTRAAFVLSKFRLNIAAIHNYRPHPDGDYMVFTLDPECTNLVLRSAKGVWHTQSNPDGRGEVSKRNGGYPQDVPYLQTLTQLLHLSHTRQEYTRVWLLCEVSVSKVLPSFIVDYTAKKAMPRATSWLKPQVEAAASLWLKR